MNERTGGRADDVPLSEHQRPAGMDDVTVRAVGALSEALETVERARGQLYGFHQLTGRADAQLATAVDLLREAGHHEIADRLDRELVGRNVIEGRWTFQVVEEYDDGYYVPFQGHERRVRDEIAGGRRHVYEAEMKERERSRRPDGTPESLHAATPASEPG
ncbi:hypothetical protein SAMN05216266_1212 [Amycolatopsis marina]|uniref:Uncharacterized protein n=1 Tax=Amycolatopsis marina TaxID=490629 RepID=A0A1I1CAJ2_9PSEU|nr:hypothetical protein [Amycolatopsis marina]SFB57403.1 hypothetical protein SAMN05216266_1212 [Amycolatopsis marina]